MRVQEVQEQPLALKLAEQIEVVYEAAHLPRKAAAELRRLHEQKEHWIEQWSEVSNENQTLTNAVKELHAENEALREALENLTHYAECQVAAFSSGRPSLDMTLFPFFCAAARAALRERLK
jgi:exonuclease VII large subunit